MAPRPATRRERNNDFSAVGQIGRRTGITIPQGRVDENGIEEITGIFSSPQKPSPVRKSLRNMNATSGNSTSDASEDMDGMDSTGLTPTQVLSTRKSLRGASVPRSSPVRKTGINGNARRSHGVDLSPEKDLHQFDPEDRENTPAITPVQITQHTSRRFSPSPEKSPLRDITKIGIRSANGNGKVVDAGYNDFDRELERTPVDIESHEYQEAIQSVDRTEDATPTNVFFDGPIVGDDDAGYFNKDGDRDDIPSHARNSAEPIDLQFEQDFRALPARANTQKKRKSPALEEDANALSSPSQRTKKVKTSGRLALMDMGSQVSASAAQELPPSSVEAVSKPIRKKAARVPESKTGAMLSTRQESELNEIIEKVRSRPGQQKSLYILKRETPADDSVTHTRSGRISVKPLAYWRNERCVYGGGSPGASQLADGARFPLNSIKEIVRTEEVEPVFGRKKRKGKKGKNKGRSQSYDDESESEVDYDVEDSSAEPWESNSGTFRGRVSIWDSQQQAPLELEEEVDLAYARASMETQEVPGSDFKYNKLLHAKFFGAGIVDLPPGAEKRPKNSRKMLMSFFVAKGRVTVRVGPFGSEPSQFSIGKGGFWQVPRGNHYSIRNDLDKPARIFFSQGCESA